MVRLNAHFDGKVLVPDEPLALEPNQKVRISVEPIAENATNANLVTDLMKGDGWDERDALRVHPLDAVPSNFVRRPGSAAGQVVMSDDFNITPAEFEEHL